MLLLYKRSKKHNEINYYIFTIIVSFWQETLRPKRSRFAKRGGTIQYGYTKLGTHARVFIQTLTPGNIKNETR